MKSIFIILILLPISVSHTIESSGSCPESIYDREEQTVRIEDCTDEEIRFGFWDEVNCPLKLLDFSNCKDVNTATLKYKMKSLCAYIKNPFDIKWASTISNNRNLKISMQVGDDALEIDSPPQDMMKDICDNDHSDDTDVIITFDG